ncbi:YybH family protein [Parachitinimonas caeni]|uniref:DUF4440 domain-containing protein n=1 Tax=Parachitinimonas caeni TaxID=3031301 RepID=A0ABT7E269_9NEIS|nr:DUF4440 domain-containing protein [Parachitinimonas caeni]MDK2126401.1 DUF4440 domain-containing protein [Parachitinimonas caeni]
MNPLTSPGISILAALALAAPALASQKAPVQIKDGLSEPVRAWSRAVEAGDTQALARMNPASTTVFGLDKMVVRGTQNIVASYGGMFKQYQARVTIRDAHYIASGNLVHSWGLFSLRLEPHEGGEAVIVEGRFSDIASRVNGEWQYILDHASFPKTP